MMGKIFFSDKGISAAGALLAIAVIGVFTLQLAQLVTSSSDQAGRSEDLLVIENAVQAVTEIINDGQKCDNAFRGVGGAAPLTLVIGGNTAVNRVYSDAATIALQAGNNLSSRMRLTAMFIRQPPAPPAAAPPPGNMRRSLAPGVFSPLYRTFSAELVMQFRSIAAKGLFGGSFTDRVIPLTVAVDPLPNPARIRACYQNFSYAQYCQAMGGYIDAATRACIFPNFKVNCQALGLPACPALPPGCATPATNLRYLLGFDANSQPICNCVSFCP